MSVHDLPTLNAILNAVSGVLLVAGYVAIRRGRVDVHRRCMKSAFVVSALFLVSYVVYHVQVGSVKFSGEGALRTFYLALLASHVVLAIVIVPLVLVTLRRALRGDFLRHRFIARRTFPLWLYVSVTGVVVYMMLYVWFPVPGR